MIQLLQIVGGLATTWMQGKAEEVKVKQEVKIKAAVRRKLGKDDG